MRLLFLFILLYSLPCKADIWYPIKNNQNASHFIIAPKKEAQYFQPNQVLLQGKQCAAIIDSHSNFAALQSMLIRAKSVLKVPVCYLISPSYKVEDNIGIAMLQRAFPSAKWVTHKHLLSRFKSIETALSKRVDILSQSQMLSQSQIKTLTKEQQMQWQKKLAIAAERVKDWQTLTLKKPEITLKNQTLSIDLGEHTLRLTPHLSASSADIMIKSVPLSAAFAGSSADSIPHVIAPVNIQSWINTLNKLANDDSVKWLLPSHGKPYKRKWISKTKLFLTSLTEAKQQQTNSIKHLKDHLSTPQEREHFQLLYAQALKHVKTDTILPRFPHTTSAL